MTFSTTLRAVIAGLILGSAFTLAARADRRDLRFNLGHGIYLTNGEMSHIIYNAALGEDVPDCAFANLNARDGYSMSNLRQRVIAARGQVTASCEVRYVDCHIFVPNATAANRRATLNCNYERNGDDIKLRDVSVQL